MNSCPSRRRFCASARGRTTSSAAPGSANFNSAQTLAGLQIGGGASVVVAPGGGNTLVTDSLEVDASGGARLNLNDNAAVVRSGDVGSWNGSGYSGLAGLIQSGRGDGSWNGGGIATGLSDATVSGLTTIAIGSADELGYVGGSFRGVSVGSGDVLVMYTWAGDADLNGELNGDDYFWIDSNILTVQSGETELLSFHNGDFNYDGAVNGDDYFVLDSNVLQAQASGIIWPTGSGAGGLASVPEPAGAVGIGVMAAALARIRRRRGG